jgi:putative tricarboxylic transport membrane protein
MLVALAVVALGAYVVFEAATGADNPGYAQVGPGAFPAVVGTALVLAGLALLAQGLRGGWCAAWIERDQVASAEPLPAPLADVLPIVNVLLVAAALVLDVVLMPPLGFVAASATMFVLVAAAFGSRRFVLDTALGLAFAGAIYVVFVHALGLHLPVGEFWEGFAWMR